MASALDDAVKKVDDLILEVGKGMGDDAPRMRVDPDDPWADIEVPPQHVYKVRCEKTGYLMAKPFEKNNPMPGQFDQTCDYLVKMLKPVIKPKDGAKPAAPAGGEGGKKKEKPAKPAKVPQPPRARPLRRAPRRGQGDRGRLRRELRQAVLLRCRWARGGPPGGHRPP